MKSATQTISAINWHGIIHSPQLAQLLPLIHLLPQVLHSNSPKHLFWPW